MQILKLTCKIYKSDLKPKGPTQHKTLMKLENQRKLFQDFLKDFPNITAKQYGEYCSIWTQLQLILGLAKQNKAHNFFVVLLSD